MSSKFGVGFLCAALLVGTAVARPTVAPSSAPVVINQWHSNLTAAKAEAQRLNVPLLVVWGNPSCGYCTKFDAVLDSAECKEYVDNRGLILVYEKSTGGTEIKTWVGGGNWPLLRVTWWKNGVVFKDSKASGWQRPTTFLGFKNTLESYISSYVYSPVPADTSKDAYDPDNDTAAGAPTLTWGDQAKTESLKLAKKTDAPAYTDLADWFKLAVEAGKTYRVSVPAVSGLSGDAPQIGVYSDAAGTTALAGPEALTGADLEFDAAAAGDVYVKIWRPAGSDTNIQYTLSYQRFAPGTIEFAQTAVSVTESAASVTLTVKRVGGTTGAASVQVACEDSTTLDAGYTATAGEDFNGTPSPTTLTWADGNAADKTVTITLSKTVTEWEGAETFGVTLTPDAETTAGADAVVTLLEADALVTAAATYNGFVSEADDSDRLAPETKGRLVEDTLIGTITLTVSSSGSISGRAVFPTKGSPYAGAYTLRNASHQSIDDGVATITGELYRSTVVVPVTFYVDMDTGRVEGVMGSGADEKDVILFRNDWNQTAVQQLVVPYVGTYTVAFPVQGVAWPTEGAPLGSGYATITVDAAGKFRAAGKLGDGTSYSQSGTLFVVPETANDPVPMLGAVLFAAPTAYQGGYFSCVIAFGDENANGVKDVTQVGGVRGTWASFNPMAVQDYDATEPGFDVEVGVVGGWYDKAKNLQTFFADWELYVSDLTAPLGLAYTLTTRTRNLSGTIVSTRTAETAASICWQAAANVPVTTKADGTGFTVPLGDLVKTGTAADGAPLYNYATAVNPNSLRMSFNRSLGVLNGAFSAFYDYVTVLDQTGATEKKTWAHSAKSVSYNAILLQELVDDGRGLTAYGYYLYAGRSTYETATLATRTYSFKQSAEFSVSKAGLPE